MSNIIEAEKEVDDGREEDECSCGGRITRSVNGDGEYNSCSNPDCPTNF